MLNFLSLLTKDEYLYILQVQKDYTIISKDSKQNIQQYVQENDQYNLIITNQVIEVQNENFKQNYLFVNYDINIFHLDFLKTYQKNKIFEILLQCEFDIDNIVYRQFCTLLQNIYQQIENFDPIQFTLNFTKNINYKLYVDEFTKEKIGVYKIEIHPCHIKTHNNSKMGLSLFSVLGKSMQTSRGRKQFLKILNNPLKNIQGINRRQEMFQNFYSLNLIEKNKIKDTLNKYKYFQYFLNKIENENINNSLIKEIYDNLNLVIEFYNFSQNLFEEEFFFDNNQHVIKTIQNILQIFLNFANISYNDLLFSREVDQEYENLLQVRENLQFYLDHIKDKESNRIQDFNNSIQQFDLFSIPEVGYFFSIIFEQQFLESLNFQEDNEETQNADFWKILPEDFQYTFSKNEIFFFKSKTTIQLEKDVGDINCRIFEKEQLFMIEMCKQITDNRQMFITIDTQMSIIDCYNGLVQASYQYKLKKPIVLQDKNIFVAKKVRDIIKESINQEFLPYNFYSVPIADFQNMKEYDVDINQPSNIFNILTGPNNSGKTSFLKTISRSIYLAHCGLFVPAEEFITPIYDSIEFLTCLKESSNNIISAQNQSIKKLDQIIKGIEKQKLCLFFDEFLNNACQSLRSKIFQSIYLFLEQLQQEQKLQSLIFYSTHDLKLLKQEIIKPTFITQLFYMNYIYVKSEKQDIDDKLLFLYELKRGISESSFALKIFKQYFPKLSDDDVIKNYELENLKKFKDLALKLIQIYKYYLINTFSLICQYIIYND